MRGNVLEKTICTGTSMGPTLRLLDTLQVVPYGEARIACGDVVVFSSPVDRRRIAHRVIRVTPRGLKTRGDNGGAVDPWILDPGDIIGRVAYVQRADARIRIYGGLPGRLYASALRVKVTLGKAASLLFGPSYRWAARRGIFFRLIPSRMRPRIIAFERPKGKELQLVAGRFIIGRLPPEARTWWVRRPFRLFVNDAIVRETRT